jgi:hypothetical protein
VPTLVWLYLTALLYYRTSANCVALAEALATVSHDRLTRLLQGDWSGERLLMTYGSSVPWILGDLQAYAPPSHCAGIVTTGAPSLPLVSTSVKMNIRNVNSRLEAISWSSMANQWPR